ncbi:MAG: hypothetical protein WCO68_10485 [Verrucomicrobiota bacterium]
MGYINSGRDNSYLWMGDGDGAEPFGCGFKLSITGWLIGTTQQADATHHPLLSDMASALFTDPPYYDAVPYSDLSDFFFVWLKRLLPGFGEGAVLERFP